jgi:hypothetical protein
MLSHCLTIWKAVTQEGRQEAIYYLPHSTTWGMQVLHSTHFHIEVDSKLLEHAYLTKKEIDL